MKKHAILLLLPLLLTGCGTEHISERIYTQSLGIAGEDKEVISSLIERYSLSYLVYTHGADFSEVYAADGGYSHLPTPKVEVADTVGAGDSFTAVFVTSLLGGVPLKEAHERAVKVSAYVCTRHGAINSIAGLEF